VSILKDTLPKAGSKAVEEAKQFRTTMSFPKGAMKGLCTLAIDKVLVKKMPISEALKYLVQSEKDYVMSVLQEYDQWLLKNGFAQSTTLRDDQMLIEEAEKAIEESGS
jgi:hypothetical protein